MPSSARSPRLAGGPWLGGPWLTDLRLSDVSDIGPHYVTTLRAWRTRFLEHLDAVRAVRFDERFIRMCEYYLAISEAGFSVGVTQDLRMVFQKARANR